MEIKEKKIAILGFGLEGKAVAEFALKEGALSIDIFDKKEKDLFDASTISNLEDKGVKFNFGNTIELGHYDLIFRSPGFPVRSPEMLTAIDAGITVTSGTATFFDLWKGPLVGVTGTKGKGTTSSLIHEMLHFAGRKAVLVGNIGLPALSVLPNLDPETTVVFELSSFQLLEVKKSPSIAIVLMITQDHLDFHGDPSEYVEAKRNIVAFQNENDATIANIDYEASKNIADSSKAKKFWVSRKTEVDLGCFVRDGSIWVKGENREEEVIPISNIALPGGHNLENVCAAVMAGYLLELPLEAIKSALVSFRGLPHRLQLIAEKDGVKFYDDSISTTPESSIAAISAFSEPKILILGGSPKGADFSTLGKIIAEDKSIKAIIGIGSEWENIKKAINWVGESSAVIKEGFKDMDEAVESAKELATAGDIVLLSPGCASFDMFKDYKDRGEKFAEAVNK